MSINKCSSDTNVKGSAKIDLSRDKNNNKIEETRKIMNYYSRIYNVKFKNHLSEMIHEFRGEKEAFLETLGCSEKVFLASVESLFDPSCAVIHSLIYQSLVSNCIKFAECKKADEFRDFIFFLYDIFNLTIRGKMGKSLSAAHTKEEKEKGCETYKSGERPTVHVFRNEGRNLIEETLKKHEDSTEKSPLIINVNNNEASIHFFVQSFTPESEIGLLKFSYNSEGLNNKGIPYIDVVCGKRDSKESFKFNSSDNGESYLNKIKGWMYPF